MATREQLIESIRQAGRAGDQRAVQVLGAELKRMDAGGKDQRQNRPAKRPVSQAQGVLEGIGQSVAGWSDILGGKPGQFSPMGPLSPLYDMGAAYLRSKIADATGSSKYESGTAGKIAGNVIGTLPAGGVANPWLGGALGGAVLSNKRNPAQFVADTALGAVSGKVGDMAGRAIAKRFAKRAAASAVSNAPRVLPGRAAAVRQARFNRVGVQRPTVGQVTRDPRVWNFEREAMKRAGGDPILQAMQGVDNDLATAARSLIDGQGGSIGPEAMGKRVIDALDARNSQLSREVSALYQGVREASGDARIPSLENFKAAMAHPDWADNMQFDDMAAAINKRLARYADADGGQAGLNVKQAEELRKFIGNLGSNDRQTFAMRRVFQDALDTDVLDNMGGQPFAQARAAAKARFNEFSKTYAGKLADERIAPERVGNSLRNAGTSLDDLRSMVNSLQQSPGGDQAIAAMRSQYLDDVLSKGITPDGKVNGTTMAREFAKNAPRLRTVLEPDAYKQARRIAMAARDATAEVPYANVNNSNTASALGNMIAPQTTQGLFGRVLNSPVGRTAAHIAASPAGPVGNAGVEGAIAGINFASRRAGDKALERQIAMTLDPQLAAQEMARAQEEELIKQLIARQVSGRISGPFGGLGVAGGGLVFGNSQ